MAVKQEPYDVGDTVPVVVDLTDALDVHVNPTGLTVKVKPPNAATVAHPIGDLTHPSAGVYVLNVLFDDWGEWVVRAEATGAIPLVRERRIKIRKPDIAA